MGFAARCIRDCSTPQGPGKRSLRSASLGLGEPCRGFDSRWRTLAGFHMPITEPQRGSGMQPRHGCAAGLPGETRHTQPPPRGTPAGSRQGCPMQAHRAWINRNAGSIPDGHACALPHAHPRTATRFRHAAQAWLRSRLAWENPAHPTFLREGPHRGPVTKGASLAQPYQQVLAFDAFADLGADLGDGTGDR